MQLSELGQQAGYAQDITPYTFRRGAATIVDRKYWLYYVLVPRLLGTRGIYFMLLTFDRNCYCCTNKPHSGSQ